MFAGTILPYKHASTTSDGHKLLEVLRRQPAHDSHRFLLWLAYLLQSSVRLRDVPGWLVECVGSNSNSGDGIDRYVDSIRVGQALDVDVPDIPVARRLLEGFRSDYGTSHWLVACEAFLAAAHEHDVDRAKILLSELESPSDVPQLTLAAEAAVAMLEGRTDVAKQKCAEMTSIVREEKDFPDLTYRDLERKILALEAG